MGIRSDPQPTVFRGTLTGRARGVNPLGVVVQASGLHGAGGTPAPQEERRRDARLHHKRSDTGEQGVNLGMRSGLTASLAGSLCCLVRVCKISLGFRPHERGL